MAKTNIRTPMPVKMRAKQFAMFDAMKGLTEAIKEREKYFCRKKELSESRISEINDQLVAINEGDVISVHYYCEYDNRYRQIAGTVVKLDSFWKEVQIDKTSIGFSEIESITFVKTTTSVYNQDRHSVADTN